MEEWHSFLRRKHGEKAHKGDEWLRSVFHTLHQNIAQDAKVKEEEEEEEEDDLGIAAVLQAFPPRVEIR